MAFRTNIRPVSDNPFFFFFLLRNPDPKERKARVESEHQNPEVSPHSHPQKRKELRRAGQTDPMTRCTSSTPAVKHKQVHSNCAGVQQRCNAQSCLRSLPAETGPVGGSPTEQAASAQDRAPRTAAMAPAPSAVGGHYLIGGHGHRREDSD